MREAKTFKECVIRRPCNELKQRVTSAKREKNVNEEERNKPSSGKAASYIRGGIGNR